ncbi:tRNA pseudouridine(55) synthase TruB [Flavobacteriaceae bacterium]|jgi:tRNA pseudouridine55 synthase|nr:tRNA pseudouridine(55) synthase TruB [Flavobacteriaceae bacterium]|tara:strand:- start:1687 stop:2376 length:690 start_codon:yes stop_codon:yes gene_type:complete
MQKFDVNQIKEDDIQDGKMLLVDKPLTWTSFDVVKYIRKSLVSKFKIKRIKVGHAGTLDPLATGLLIICIGKQTKQISIYQNLSKTYTGKFKLGETTPSYDAETEVNKSFNYDHIKEKDIINLSQKFTGKLMQKPPIFSALKKNGKRMYEYARENKKIEIQEREINIYEFEIIKFTDPYIEFKITCSKGTYIRSIANDFGKKLNSGSYLSELRRINIGEFSVLNALQIE